MGRSKHDIVGANYIVEVKFASDNIDGEREWAGDILFGGAGSQTIVGRIPSNDHAVS